MESNNEFMSVSLLEAAAEYLLEWNASVLPRGEHPGDEVGSDPQNRKQERSQDQQADQPHVQPRQLGKTSGDAAQDPVGSTTEADIANSIK
ncbi:hypothetical protein GCM10009813_25440 [Brevibacterium marinum]